MKLIAETLNFVNKIPDVMKTMEKLTQIKSFFKEMNDLAQEFPTEQGYIPILGLQLWSFVVMTIILIIYA